METTRRLRSDDVGSPIRRRYVPDREGLLELWAHESPRLIRVVTLFRHVPFDWRPNISQRTAAELAQHLELSMQLTSAWIEGVDGCPVGSELMTSEEAVGRLQEAQRRLKLALTSSNARPFDVEISPFGVGEPLGVAAFGMLKHELHHRGELYCLARSLGLRVPSLYEDTGLEASGFAT